MRTKPDITRQLQLRTRSVTVDEAGYVVDPEDWSSEFAEIVSTLEGIELTDLHWATIEFMRTFLADHGIAADARFVLKFLEETQGLDKADARKLLFVLYPYGYVKQACKLAGMRQPRAWSTG